MKKYLQFSCLVVVIAIIISSFMFFLLFNQWRKGTNEQYILKIITDKETYNVGEKVMINISIINLGTESINLEIQMSNISYQPFFITDNNNTIISTEGGDPPIPWHKDKIVLSSNMTICLFNSSWNQTYRDWINNGVPSNKSGTQVPPGVYRICAQLYIINTNKNLFAQKEIVIRS